MRGFVPPDPETNVSEIKYAVISTRRTDRKRYPSACVAIVENAAAALAAALEGQHAARVLGPSKSSEGQYIYYLVEWL
jgi:hypothetical protein